jgi:hypothetical protein
MKLRVRKELQIQAPTVKKAEEGAILPWHRVALNGIWAKRHCTPSVKSRREWAAARNITPTHVHKFFWGKKAKAKRKNENLDEENEDYDLDIEEGGMEEEIIVKHEIKEELESSIPATPQTMQTLISRQNSRELASKTTRNLLTPSRHQNHSQYLISTGTPELSSSNFSFLCLPLLVDDSSSPMLGRSFFSPPSLLTSSSDYSDYPIWESSSPPASRWKRKILDAYMDPPRKKTRLLKTRQSPVSPSRAHPRALSLLDTALIKDGDDQTSIQIKQELMDDDNILEFLPSGCSMDQTSKDVKLELLDDTILKFLSYDESAVVTSSENRSSMQEISRSRVVSVPSSPDRSSSILPASSPVPSPSPGPQYFKRLEENETVNPVPDAVIPRLVYDKDDFCCFCGLTNIDEGQHASNYDRNCSRRLLSSFST